MATVAPEKKGEQMDRFGTYLREWYEPYAKAIARHAAGCHDHIWERGVLELVSPLEPHRRDQARRLQIGLPWGTRLDSELYWRIMYAAHAEALVAAGVTEPFDGASVVRTAVEATFVALQMEEPDRRSFYADIVARAADEIRIRAGKSSAPKPFEPGATVMADGAASTLVGYHHDGGLLVDRETRPDDPQGRTWTLDAKQGRWQTQVMPWQLRHDF